MSPPTHVETPTLHMLLSQLTCTSLSPFAPCLHRFYRGLLEEIMSKDDEVYRLVLAIS